MLRTNSKQAIENIRKYIFDSVDVTNYECTGMKQPENFNQAAQIVMDCFYDEFYWGNEKRFRPSEQAAFEYWLSGLPSIIDSCYYYNRSAVDDLGTILEETENEKNRYSESDAAKLLSYLIYRECKKGAAKNVH